MISTLLATATNALSLGRLKYGWYSMPYTSEANAVIIGGCSRSGTTLLYSLLNAHSRLAIGLETALFTGNTRTAGLAARTRLPQAQLVALYRASRCYAEFAERVLVALADQQGKPRWGDKSPVNVTVLDGIFRHFPNARFIHVIRDGRDVVCSLRKYPPSFGHRYDPVNPWPICVERWNVWTRAGLAHRGDPRYLEVRYEDLVSAPETSLRGIVDWLGEPWEPGMLEAARQTRVSTHPQVGQAITTTSRERWRQELTAEARELFRGPAARLLVDLGYASDESWIRG